MNPKNDEICPTCGGELYSGYGLAGGGIGVYTSCLNDDCDYLDKTQDLDDGPRTEP